MATQKYWIIATPTESSDDKTRRRLDGETAARGLSTNFPFRIPSLKVGTLDSLVTLSDELEKMDQQIGNACTKFARAYRDTWKNDSDDSDGAKKLDPPEIKIGRKSMREYVENFNWDPVRYPQRAALRANCDRIFTEVGKSEEELKKSLTVYNEVRQSYLQIQRKETGSLQVKPLNGIIVKEDVIETEHLTTLFIVVPKPQCKEFMNEYLTYDEPLKRFNKDQDEEKDESKVKCKDIVPGSAKRLTPADYDDEFALFKMIVFKKGEETVKNNLHKKRFVVRPFVYNPLEQEQTRELKATLQIKREQSWKMLISWTATTYADVFAKWIHVKAMRTFVEAVLRYGLPVDFVASLVVPGKGKDQKLRKALGATYANLANSASDGADDEAADVMGGGKYYPYVSLEFSLTE